MKNKLFQLGLLLVISSKVFAQGVGINNNGAAPNASAILDVSSTTHGMLLPRMTETQRDAISGPETSLLIYQTNNDSGFYYYDGSNWIPFLTNSANANSGWSLKGNTGTTPIDNFIGTIDSVDWVIRTDNTEQMRVTANGNVGIGTASPNSTLDIISVDVTADHAIHTQTNVSNSDLYMNAAGAVGADDALYINTDVDNNSTTDKIIFGHNGHGNNAIELMRIEEGGNVGIGIASPENLLHLNGNITLSSTAVDMWSKGIQVGNSFVQQQSNNIALAYNFYRRNSDSKMITMGGTDAYAIRMGDFIDPSVNKGIGFFADANVPAAGGDMGNPTLRMVLTSSGNLGIGTSNITSLLTLGITNANNQTKKIEFRRSNNTTAGGLSCRSNASGTFRVSIDDQTGNETLSARSGNIGIGTIAPGQKLDINGGNGRVQSGFSWLTNSDRRYKKNITTLQFSLDKIMAIRGVRYDLLDDDQIIENKGKHIGFIAQELEREFPEFVITEENGYKSVSYDKMTAVLVQAIKEQQQIIEKLKQKANQVDNLNAQQETLQQQIQDLESYIKSNTKK